MVAIASTQMSLDFAQQKFSGVYSVSGTLMIARIPGVGSKSVELTPDAEIEGIAHELLLTLLQDAQAQGLLAS